jgi:hypothetical protein
MTSNEDFSLLKTIPGVLRARGFRLYLADGKRRQKKRLVDLWLNGGAAVLGHTPPNLLRELKNAASRGLYAPFPHFTEGRLLKALSRLLPGYTFRLYAAPPQAEVFNSGSVKLWRPFIDPESPFAAADEPLLIPVLPGIQAWRYNMPLGLCLAAIKDEVLLSQLPPGDMLSPILLAIAARGVYDILASAERAKPALPRINKALQKSSSIWKRQGIYLYLKEKTSQETWALLFQQFLDAGFLLPPVPAHPVILPGELSTGEEAKLSALFC